MTPNFYTLALQLTPTAMRHGVWNALARALAAPFGRIGDGNAAFAASKRQRLEHNGQVRLLERIANLLTVGQYDPDSPAIYIDEAIPLEEFIVSPNGNWALQSSIHRDSRAKDHWDYLNGAEAPERYGILHDSGDRARSLGFEVHLTPPLAPNAPVSELKQAYTEHGGDTALRDIVDTYKLAGKQYTVIYDD